MQLLFAFVIALSVTAPLIPVSYALTGAPSNPKNDIASWVAVDSGRNYGYGKEWQLGNTLNVYHLADWSFAGEIVLDMALQRIQGAKVRRRLALHVF